jgi:hypothetical protein
MGCERCGCGCGCGSPRGDPLDRPPGDYDLFVAWGPGDAPVLAPDDPADALRGVTRPVGSLRRPRGRGLLTLLATVYEEPPGADVAAVPFRLPASGRTVWVQHEVC